MKTVKKLAAQGDVIFRRVDAIPKGFRPKEKQDAIVAHSETGHHHTAEGLLWEEPGGDDMLCFLQVGDTVDFTDVIHHRPHDTHETLRLLGKGSIWEIRRQREHTPEGWRRVED